MTSFGFDNHPDAAGSIIRAFVQRCDDQFQASITEDQILELRRRAEERGPYPASIKGFPPSCAKTDILKILDSLHDTDSDKSNMSGNTAQKRTFCRFMERVVDPKGIKYFRCTLKCQRCIREGCNIRFQSDLDRTQRFDYYPLVKGDFTIPGYGEPGGDCCAVDNGRISKFSKDFKHVRVHRITCKRVGCPRCYRNWMKTRAFEITLAMEISSYFRGERPFSVVYSVRPKEVFFEQWTWDNLNHSLINRGYRRGRKVGIDGGFVVFHPFRIRKHVKKKLRKYRKQLHGRERDLTDGDVGLWRMIRQDVLGYGDLARYVKVGPHVHGVCMGQPTAHRDRDYFIGVDPEIIDKRKTGRPHRLKETRDVVAKVLYLLTHCGVSTLNKIIQPTRRYGCMYDFQVKMTKRRGTPIKFELAKIPDPEDWRLFEPEWTASFEREWLPDKCREIAGLLGMSWDDDVGLVMKPDADDDKIVWLPMWKLYNCIGEIRGSPGLPLETVLFFDECLDYLEKYGTPPPFRPEYEAESGPLYWAAGYLRGINIPSTVNVVRDLDDVEPEEIVNAVDIHQENRVEFDNFVLVCKDNKNIDRKAELVKQLSDPDGDVRTAALGELHALGAKLFIRGSPENQGVIK